MPARKRKRTYSDKGPKKKRRKIQRRNYINPDFSNNALSVTTSSVGNLIPSKKSVKLKYGTHLHKTGTENGQHNFRMNSVYDPDYTNVLTDHQPLGFDEWSVMYNRYRVNAVKLELTAVQHDSAETAQCFVAAFPQASTISPLLSISHALEMQHSVYGFLGNTSAGKSQCHLELYVDIKKYLGMSSLDEDYTAGTTTNPIKAPWISIYWKNLLGINSDISLICELTYYVEFYGPAMLGQS